MARCLADGYCADSSVTDKWVMDGKLDITRAQVRDAKRGGKYVYMQVTDPQRNDASGYIINDQYSAKLAPAREKGKWFLIDFTPGDYRDASPGYVKTINEVKTWVENGLLLVAGLRLYGGEITPDRLHTLPNFTVDREGTSVTPSRITLAFSYNCSNLRGPTTFQCRCVAVFDPTSDFPLLSYKESTQGPESRHQREATLTYTKVDDNTCTVETRYVDYTEQDKPINTIFKRTAREESTSKATVRFGPIPDSEFTLESLGLEIPAGRSERRGTSLYLWLAGAGVVLLTGAALLRRRWARI